MQAIRNKKPLPRGKGKNSQQLFNLSAIPNCSVRFYT